MKHLLHLLPFVFLLWNDHPLHAQVYVRANSNCTVGCGGSWANAYKDLQDALADTDSGDIWIASGTYKPVNCNPCTEAEKELSFYIKPDLALYGGFAGTENNLAERDIAVNPTILSGDIGMPGDSTDNSYKVLVAENSTTATILDGFIIEEGNADGSFGFSSGGGLYIDANPEGTADIQVRNCTFRNNYGGGGGAVAIDCVLGGVSNALFQNCLFEENTASLRVVSSGGALFMQGNSGAQIKPRILDCTFRNNFCGNDGGAISATPTGAGSLLAFEVDNCLFENNQSADRGGAIWYRMSSEGQSAVVIRNSEFRNNLAGGQGGAIFARSSFDNVANDAIVNCRFFHNSADGSSNINDGEGGAVFLRGSQGGTRNHQLINCVFAKNSASERGGAIATTSFFATEGILNADIINCTFYRNSTQGSGGAIHAEGVQGVNIMRVRNSILWRDSSATTAEEMFNAGADCSVAYSNIDGGLPPNIADGGNNTAVNPEFAAASDGDLRLAGCSPLINAGDNAAVLPIADPDPDGDPRIHQGTVDLGAYEIGILHVDQSAIGLNNGRSWIHAFVDLQDALKTARSGDQIWVARGTYFPTDCTNCTEQNKQAAFRLVNNVELYGGFQGTETDLEQRDWEMNATILSGDIGAATDSTDNVYKVVIAENASSKTILDGFIIEEGNADGSFGFSSGGGLFIDANPAGRADLQVRNCTFRHNYGGGGGAVAIDCVLGGVSNALFRNCLFEENTASLRVVSSGGALFMQGNSGARISPRIVQCTFRNNFCGNDGGAISATPTGAGSLLAFEVDSCLFENNRATDRGGAIWYRMSSEGLSTVSIQNSTFRGNRAGGQGGAIFARSSFDNVANDTIVNCQFYHNTADGSSSINDGEGGAIFLRGSQGGNRNHQLINCLLVENSASERGGAIATTSFFAAEGTLRADIVNCTFYGNTTPGEGGAIHSASALGLHDLRIQNSILWQDTAGLAGKEIFTTGGTFSVAHSIVAGELPQNVNNEGNNQSADPQFLDPADEDFRLPSCSPAVNAGANEAIPIDVNDLDEDGDNTERIPLDLGGQARVYEDIIDLGAYEWSGEPERFDSLSVQVAPVSCTDQNDGGIQLIPVNGQAPYQYQWGDGTTAPQRTQLSAGEYLVTVTDNRQCTVSDTVIIPEPTPLQIEASRDTTICPGASLLLSVREVNGQSNLSYVWDQNLGQETEIVVNPETTTLYIVEAIDSSNCSARDSVLITVIQAPVVDINGQLTLCNGDTTRLSAGTFTTYRWSTGDTTQSIAVNQAGNYSLTVTDDNGCRGEDMVTVEVSETLQPEIDGPLSICNGDTTLLSTETFDTYLWSTGDTTQSIAVNQAGNYSLTVTDVNGCRGEDMVTVEVSETLQPEIDGPLSICNGDTTRLTAGTFAGYQWSTGDTTQSIAVNQAGNYSLTVTDDNGCRGEENVTVTQEESKAEISADRTLICRGEEAIISVTGGDLVDWLNEGSPGFTKLEERRVLVSPTENTNYQAIASSVCGVDTLAITIEVFGDPEVEAGSDVEILPGESTQLKATGALVYQWSPTFMLSCIDCSSSTATPLETTTYTVIGTNEAGCRGEDSVTVSVLSAEAAQELVLYNGITPNGDGRNDELIFEILEKETSDPNNELIIFNRWGDIVYRAAPYRNDWPGVNQNGQALPTGTYYYLLRIDLGEGLIYRGDVTIIR